MKALIVDDVADDRKILKYNLEKHGYESVIEAVNGQEGLEMAEIHRPDLIISDALMPVMDGYQFIRAAKKDKTLASIPFIFYSAIYTGDKDVELALSLGAEGFIIKPKEPQEFWQELCAILEAHKQGQKKGAGTELIEEEEDYLRKYSKIVAIKLETKVRELEKEIAERRQTEEALQDNLHFHQTLIDSVPLPIFYKDAQGRYLGCNSAFEKLFNKPKKQIIGKTVYDIAPKELAEIYKITDDEIFNSPGVKIYEAVIVSADGKKHDVIVNKGQFLKRDGSPGGVIGAIFDITERKDLEKQLLQAQKIESIGTLAGGIAHDFNNILAAIIGNAEMAMQILPEYSTAHTHLEQVLKSSERARNLVKQVLAFSRKSEEDREPMEMKKAVTEVTRMLSSTLPATIEIQENCTSAGWIMGSVIQMHQVLLNLCTNAFHAMREKGNGVLGIDLSDVNLDSRNIDAYHDLLPGDYVKLSVIDAGTGIAPEIMNRIFDPFFTTKGVGEGTGMGLSVVYGIVKSHGGDITVESELGKGTAFHILLPRTLGRAAEKEQVEQTVPRGTERILLVDDEAIIVEVGQKMLEMLGYRVTPARSSTEALDIFKKGPDAFDLVITDYTMPKMDGYELAQKMMAIRPGIPIIMNTGYNETISQEKALAAGIREFLLKPLNLRKMGEVVRRVLDM